MNNMFSGMKGMAGQFQLIQRLMADDNFKAFISNPKVQEVFKDPEFKAIAQSQDFSRILSHPKFAALMQDPELAALMAKVNPQQYLKS